MSSNNPSPYAPPAPTPTAPTPTASNPPAPTYPTPPAPAGQPYGYAPPRYAATAPQPSVYGPPATPGYGQAPAPQWAPPPEPRKRRKLALVLGIAAAVIVLGSAGVGVALFMGLKSVDGGARTAASQYYSAMVARNYSQAYTYLAPGMTLTYQGQEQTLDPATFTEVAKAYDGARGTVKGYVINDVALHASTDHGTSADVTMLVQRDGRAYDVHLKLQLQQGGNWQIVEFDSL